MQRHGQVIQEGQGTITVQLESQAGSCGGCASKSQCGIGILGAGKSQRGMEQIELPNNCDAAVGDNLVISVADGTAMRSVLLSYGLPILGFIAGAIGGNRVAGWLPANADLVSGLTALLLGSVGWFVARRLCSQPAQHGSVRAEVISVPPNSAGISMVTSSSCVEHPASPERDSNPLR